MKNAWRKRSARAINYFNKIFSSKQSQQKYRGRLSPHAPLKRNQRIVPLHFIFRFLLHLEINHEGDGRNYLIFFAFSITIVNNIIINAGFFVYFHPINFNRCPQLIILAIKFKFRIKLIERFPAWCQKVYSHIKFFLMTIIFPKTYNFKKERNINKLLLVNVFTI